MCRLSTILYCQLNFCSVPFLVIVSHQSAPPCLVSCNSIVCHSSSLLAVAMYHLVLYISELYLVCTLLYYWTFDYQKSLQSGHHLDNVCIMQFKVQSCDRFWFLSSTNTTVQCSKQREYILLFGTNLCITSKLHHLCFKKVDKNIL